MQIIELDSSEIKLVTGKKITWKDTFRKNLYEKNFFKIRSAKKKRDFFDEERSNLGVKNFIENIND